MVKEKISVIKNSCPECNSYLRVTVDEYNYIRNGLRKHIKSISCVDCNFHKDLGNESGISQKDINRVFPKKVFKILMEI